MRVKPFTGLFVLLLLLPTLAAASPLGLAGDYNEFVFGSIDLQYTDSFGGVAAGGDVRLKNVSVASRVSTPLPAGELVVGGDLFFDEGSVGYLDPDDSGSPASAKGTIVVGGSATLGLNEGFPNVGFGQLHEGRQSIDFSAAWDHLTRVSSLWGALPSNGTTDVLRDAAGEVYRIDLRGTDQALNVFDLSKLNAAGTTRLDDLGFYLDAPATSTILVNVPGDEAFFQSFGYYFLDPATGGYIKGSEDGAGLFPDTRILYNFFEAEALTLSMIEIHGSVLAPWADAVFYNGHIEGNLIARSLSGWNSGGYHGGEAHDELFDGNLPVPEPATFVLLGCGLMLILLRSRRPPAVKAA